MKEICRYLYHCIVILLLTELVNDVGVEYVMCKTIFYAGIFVSAIADLKEES